MAAPRRGAYIGTLPQGAAVANAAAATVSVPAAITGGEAPTEAEHNALRTAAVAQAADAAALRTQLNALLAALRAANIIAT
jgi:hypothetical protein